MELTSKLHVLLYRFYESIEKKAVFPLFYDEPYSKSLNNCLATKNREILFDLYEEPY